MSSSSTPKTWSDDEDLPLPLPRTEAAEGDEPFLPDEDSDLGLAPESAQESLLDDAVGVDEPGETELASRQADEGRSWIEDGEGAGDALEGTEAEFGHEAEDGWTADNEAADLDVGLDDELAMEPPATPEDDGQEGLGDEALEESMVLPPLRTGDGALADADDEDALDGALEPGRIFDEERMQVAPGEWWQVLPGKQVRLDRASERRPPTPARRVELAGGASWGVDPAGQLVCHQGPEPDRTRCVPEVGPVERLASDGRRRLAVLSREPSGKPRLSLSLDGGESFERVRLPSAAFPRDIVVHGAALLAIVPDAGVLVHEGEAWRQVLRGAVSAACVVLEEDEPQVYALLAADERVLLLRRGLAPRSGTPTVALDLGASDASALRGQHHAGLTSIELTGPDATWIARISCDGSPLS